MAAKPSYEHDVFISYRRADAGLLAQWLRDRLIKYRLPRKVAKKLESSSKTTKESEVDIFLDTSYERAGEDFLNGKLLPALRISKTLFVIVTPLALGQEVEGSWMHTEIDTFVALKKKDPGRKVIVIRGPGAREEEVPRGIESLSIDAKTSKRVWDYADASSFSRWWWLNLFSWKPLDDCAVKLAASIYNISDKLLPLMNRAEARKRFRRLILVIAVFILIAASLTVLTIWALRERDRANEQAQLALSQQMSAQSLLLSQDDPAAGMQMALEAWSVRNTTVAESSLRYALMQRQIPAARIQMGSAQWFSENERNLFTFDGRRLSVFQLKPDLLQILGVAHPISLEGVWVWASSDGKNIAVSDPINGLTIWDLNIKETPLVKDTTEAIRSSKRFRGGRGDWSYFVKGGRLQLSNRETQTVITLKKASRVEIPCPEVRGGVGALPFQRASGLCEAISKSGTYKIRTNEDGSSVIFKGQEIKSVLGEHKNRVWSAAFSDDEKWVATASTDGTVRIWDMETARSVAILRELEDLHSWVAFSPKGNWVLTPRELWHADWRGKALKGPCVDTVAFDPSGRYLIGTQGYFHKVAIWDLNDRSNRPAQEREAIVAAEKPSSYSWDGKQILGFKGNTVVISYLQEGGVWKLLKTGRALKRVAFLGQKDEQILTLYADGSLAVWDVASQQEVQSIQAEEGIDAVAVSQPGDIVLASRADKTFFYQYDSGSFQYRSKLIGTIAGYSDDALNIDANQVVTYSEKEKAVYLWSLPDGAIVAKTPVSAKPQKVGFRGHQTFYIQWDESNLKFIANIGPNAEPPVEIPVRDWRIRDAELNQNGRVLMVPSETKAGTAGGIHTVTLWDAASGIALADLYGQTNLVEDATFSPDNRRIATAYHCGVLVFESPGCLGGDELIAEAKRLGHRP